MRFLIVFFAALFLSGCASLSGNYEERLAIGPNGQIAYSKLTGSPIKLKVRQSRSAAIAQQGAEMMRALPQRQPGMQLSDPCPSIPAETLKQLSASAQAKYVEGLFECKRVAAENRPIEILGYALAQATGQRSDAAQLMDSVSKSIAAVERETTNRFRAIANPLALTIGVKSVATSFQKSNEAIRDVGIAAAKTGNTTTVGNIAISSSQNGTANGTGGDGGAGGEGPGGAGGAGTGSVNNTKDGDVITLNIGGNASVATDDAMSQAGVTKSQQLEPSANGSIVDDSKLNGSDTVDEFNGDKDVSDDDGGQSLL